MNNLNSDFFTKVVPEKGGFSRPLKNVITIFFSYRLNQAMKIKIKIKFKLKNVGEYFNCRCTVFYQVRTFLFSKIAVKQGAHCIQKVKLGVLLAYFPSQITIN